MEENILKLVRLLESEGLYFNRYGNKYCIYVSYTNFFSIAIYSHHQNINLDRKVCITMCNDWNKYIINLPIPINTRQRNFIVEKILDISYDINITKITDYNFNKYGLR